MEKRHFLEVCQLLLSPIVALRQTRLRNLIKHSISGRPMLDPQILWRERSLRYAVYKRDLQNLHCTVNFAEALTLPSRFSAVQV